MSPQTHLCVHCRRLVSHFRFCSVHASLIWSHAVAALPRWATYPPKETTPSLMLSPHTLGAEPVPVCRGERSEEADEILWSPLRTTPHRRK